MFLRMIRRLRCQHDYKEVTQKFINHPNHTYMYSYRVCTKCKRPKVIKFRLRSL